MLRKLLLSLLLAALSLEAFAPQAQAAGIQQFTNNAVSTLSAPITSTSATTLHVASSALFPTPSGGNWFIATLEHLVSGVVTAQEIVKVTVVSGTTWTIARGQEGTNPATWVSGDTIALLPTAGGLAQFVQPTQAQAQGYNFATDTGTANAYSVTLAPALTAHVQGLPIRFLAAHANTGASTFNDGAGVGTLLLPSGSQLTGAEITAGGIYEAVYSASGDFVLVGTNGNVVITTPLASAQQAINGPLAINSANPYLGLFNTASAANTGKWILQAGAANLTLFALNDALNADTVAINITRTGDTVTAVGLGGTSQSGTTQTTGDNTNNFATTAFVQNTFGSSPGLGGVPTAPNATLGTSTTQIATTAFATLSATTAQNNAETYAAAQAAAAQSNAETYAAGQAATAQANSEAYTAANFVANTAIGANTTTQLGGTSGIGTGYTSITFSLPVVGGATYAMTFDSDLNTTAGVGALDSRIAVTGGSGSITPVGTGLCLGVSGAGGGGSLLWAQNNPASMTGVSITNSGTPHERCTGSFSVGASVTAVAYQLALSSGSLTIPAGGFVNLLRTN